MITKNEVIERMAQDFYEVCIRNADESVTSDSNYMRHCAEVAAELKYSLDATVLYMLRWGERHHDEWT